MSVKTVNTYFKRKRPSIPRDEIFRYYGNTYDNKPSDDIINGVVEDD